MRTVGEWDRWILDQVDSHRSGWANGLARFVMDVGISSWTLTLGGLIALALVVWLRAYRPAIAGVAALVVAVVASAILKGAFGRPRPPSRQALVFVGGASFPSTHAAATAALSLAVLVAWAWSSGSAARVATTVIVALDVLVGVCMVYLGAHWASDVVAGWVLGGLIGIAIGRLARRPRATPRAGARPLMEWAPPVHGRNRRGQSP